MFCLDSLQSQRGRDGSLKSEIIVRVPRLPANCKLNGETFITSLWPCKNIDLNFWLSKSELGSAYFMHMCYDSWGERSDTLSNWAELKERDISLPLLSYILYIQKINNIFIDQFVEHQHFVTLFSLKWESKPLFLKTALAYLLWSYFYWHWAKPLCLLRLHNHYHSNPMSQTPVSPPLCLVKELRLSEMKQLA